MKFNVAAAAASAAFLVGGVNAEDQKVLKDETSSVAESATKAAPELPTFTVSFAFVYLFCQLQSLRCLGSASALPGSGGLAPGALTRRMTGLFC